LLGLSVRVAAQQSPAASTPGIISVQSSPKLFATMSALYAAGYGAQATWKGDSPEFAAYREQLRQTHGPAADALRKYYRDHLLADPAETLSRFVSFGLVIAPPPHFPYEFVRNELPPDVLSIEDFNATLSDFYQEAKLDQQWARLQPSYERQIELLNGPVSKLVIVVNSYLREIVSASTGRRFIVLVEPLIGSRTSFRIYGAQYTVIVSSGEEPPLDDIRHAYLHFMLDPLASRYGTVVDTRRSLLEVAARAPRLPPDYLEDFPAFLTECLIKAVELHLQKLPLAKLDAAFDRDDADGFILVRPLFNGLQKFEQSEPAMSYYYPDLIESVNVAEEKKRLANFQFPAAEPEAAPSQHLVEVSELDQWLAQGDNAIASQNVPAAIDAFNRVLRKYPGNVRATYGLAVASALKGDVSRAGDLFQQVVAAGAKPQIGGISGTPDLSVLAWSHVYLGRIHDAEGEQDEALAEYRAALAVSGAPEKARTAAQKGLQGAYKPIAHAPDATPQ